MTKVQCNSCLQFKDPEEFNWRYKALGIRHPTCRECQKPFRKNWYEDNKATHLENVRERKERVRQEAREYVWNYLTTHPCIRCGEPDPTVLEFHHRHGKKSEVSKMVADGLSIATIQAEINKCDVLCANCHRRQTSQSQGWFRK
jgi:hypothetical protein